MNPEVLNLIATFAAVNAVLVVLLAVMSYATSALMLELLSWLDRWMDPSRKLRDQAVPLAAEPGD